jgi:uncharacterized membrane protein
MTPDESWPARLLVGCVLALLLAVRGRRKGSLSGSGAVAAALIGVLHFTAGVSFGVILIAFYMTGSAVRAGDWRPP